MFNVFLNFRIVAGGQNSSNSDHEDSREEVLGYMNLGIHESYERKNFPTENIHNRKYPTENQ